MPTITRKIELHLCTEGLSEEQPEEKVVRTTTLHEI